MDINIDKIRELADLAIEKNLAEITVEDGDKAVTIRLPGAPSQQQYVAAAPSYIPPHKTAEAPAPASAQPAAPKAASADEDRYVKVTAPMVGTYYAAPSPGAEAFAKEGQNISKGQTLCIIEAMKLMNELESEVSGKVVKILVENGQPLEFGQTIMLVDPS